MFEGANPVELVRAICSDRDLSADDKVEKIKKAMAEVPEVGPVYFDHKVGESVQIKIIFRFI